MSGKTGSATRASWSPEPDERRAQRKAHSVPVRAQAHGSARYDYLHAAAAENLIQVGYGNLSDPLAAEAADLLVELILASA